MIILGIDPGIANCGYALVKRTKNKHRKKYELLDHGIVTTKPGIIEGVRLSEIKWELDLMIDKCTVVCVEKVFFSRNVSSAMNTAKVIGIAQIMAARHNRPFIEVRPTDAKEAIGCDKKADKKKIIAKVNKMFKTQIKNEHTADAISVAICGILTIEQNNI